MGKKTKRVAAWLLAGCLMVGLVPQYAWAADPPISAVSGATQKNTIDKVAERQTEVLLYSKKGNAVLGKAKSSAISSIAAVAQPDGTAQPESGAYTFTVQTVDGQNQGEVFYRFLNESDGYLAVLKDKRTMAYVKADATDIDKYDIDWVVAAFNNGYELKSRTVQYKESPQYLEIYKGDIKLWSRKDSDDKDIFTFRLHPVSGAEVVNGIVPQPAFEVAPLSEGLVGADYTFGFAVNGTQVEAVTATLGKDALTLSKTDDAYEVRIPAALAQSEQLSVTLSATVDGAVKTKEVVISLKDEPSVEAAAPKAGEENVSATAITISATLQNAKQDAKAVLTLKNAAGKAVVDAQEMTVANDAASYVYNGAALQSGRYTAEVTVTRADQKTATASWSFYVGKAEQRLYFGQLHSHTSEYSDGSGLLSDGLSYVESRTEQDKVDFVAFTDHSNYFDTSKQASPAEAMYDASKMTADSAKKWQTYRDTVAEWNEQQAGKKVALAGFEMTWSGGPGHMNVFNSKGVVSRNNSALNNKTDDAGLQKFYETLKNEGNKNVIAQFNHPGKTFGTFADFEYWDPMVDARINLLEVGNGEGAIHSGGHFPSYDYYTMALDKGWHVAPTNNQDNHKGKWGDANDARDVILTDDFTEQGIYDALAERRVYATEDKNLEIYYTVNGKQMGYIYPVEQSPKNVEVQISLSDPDATDRIERVELVANAGTVVKSWNQPTTGTLSVTLPTEYSYYYVRVLQADGDVAVTAPVWVKEVVKLGISDFSASQSMPVTNEALTLTTALFNGELTAAAVKSLTVSVDGKVIDTQSNITMEKASKKSLSAKWTPTDAKLYQVRAEAVIAHEGKEYSYAKELSLDVQDDSKLVYFGVDGAHYNEYVTGNYKDSVGNFAALAEEYSVRVVTLKTSDELLAALANPKYKAMAFSAPSRRLAAAQKNPAVYSADELAAIRAFHERGGTVILAGWSDYYENYKDKLPVGAKHMAETQNEVLAALGANLRIADDASVDDKKNGGQSQRLYFTSYNFGSPYAEDIIFDAANPDDDTVSQVFSQYGGCTIYAVDENGKPTGTLPAGVTPIVYGHATTYSKDSDKDGFGAEGGVPKYAFAKNDNRLMVLASQSMAGKGDIIVAGAAFFSNFEVKMTLDNATQKGYSNFPICENIVQGLNATEVDKIAAVQAETREGVKFVIEGTVTSNASGYDKDTAFFDCIYLQDDTAGINAFPVAGSYKIGDRVRITGWTSSYQGERQINVQRIKKVGEGEAPAPRKITAAELNNKSALGSLVQLSGKVTDITRENGLVQTILMQDAAGEQARIFIDGYINSQNEIAPISVGEQISAIGLASYDNTFKGAAARLRVRSRSEIKVEAAQPTQPQQPTGTTTPMPVGPQKPTTQITDPDTPTAAQPTFADVPQKAWYAASVAYVTERGWFKGVSATAFAPQASVTRGMATTVLHRVSKDGTTLFAADFSDVAAGDWFANGVAWASKNGVAKGMGNRTFAPDQTITREQLAVMLKGYADYKKLSLPQGAARDFADRTSISAWAKDAIDWASAAGLLQGDGNGCVNPQKELTRAELAALLQRIDTMAAA